MNALPCRAKAGLAAAAVGTAATAFGRAGGGGHGGGGHSASSSGGYHSGSGFSGGGTGGIGLIGLLVVLFILWLIFRRVSRPMPGGQNLAASSMARDAAAAVLGSAMGRNMGTLQSTVAAAPIRPALPAAVNTIRADDPAFDIESFLQRAEMTFFLVKRGIQKNDAAAVRPYVNDGVFGAVTRNIGQMTARHQHALMESLNVRDVHLIDAACSDKGQRLIVHFDLVYRAKTFDETNHVGSDEGEDRRHGERWTFVRAAAARTPTGGGVTASRCPACGAELRLSLDGTCTHCRASVTDGTVDWVVADVQPAPFLGYSGDSMVGLAAPTIAEGITGLQATDSSFEMAAFLARVKTGFMALQDAWCRQDLEAGRAFLSPGAYFAWRAQLETMAAEGRRNVMEGLEFRQAVPLRIIHGRVFDDVTVRVTAVSSDYEVDGTGRVVFGDKAVRPFAEDWTFQRSIGVASSAKAGTLENTCPNCGAPLSLTQIGECRYCKAAVTSGRFDWVVSRIEQEEWGEAAPDDAADVGSEIAAMVGGAVVGGLLSSLLSQDRR